MTENLCKPFQDFMCTAMSNPRRCKFFKKGRSWWCEWLGSDLTWNVWRCTCVDAQLEALAVAASLVEEPKRAVEAVLKEEQK